MKKKKFFSFSFYFWLAFVIVMASLFFINRAIIGKAITKIKDSPSFSKPEIINDNVKETIENHNTKTNISENEKYLDIATEDTSSTKKNDIIPKDDEKQQEEDIEESKTERSITQETEIKEHKTETQEKPLSQQPKKETRNIDVYFASVSDNGIVTREKCVRSVERSLSPMVDSLNALLQGPTKEEEKHGIRSFIPADTKLISASIKEETALINLSEDFQFNRYGVEGYSIQLQQIVFTVCSFPTVKSVQFLIEGQKRDFIGSEGVWIGSPLTVNSF